MELTQEQLERFKKFLEPKMRRTECPICGDKGPFAVSRDIIKAESLTDSKDGVRKGMPLMAIICNNCGHVEFFNLSIAGVTK